MRHSNPSWWPARSCAPLAAALGCAVLTTDAEAGCSVTCPPGHFMENEPCGTDSVNPGCRVTPPLFQTFDCGKGVCGALWADGGAHDEDWYEVFVPDPDGDGVTEFCLDFVSESAAVAEVYTGPCASLTLLADAASGGCVPDSTCVCVPAPGVVLVRVFPGTIAGGPIDNGLPCGTPSLDYDLGTSCTDCPVDEGACCFVEGGTPVCTETTLDDCNQLGGTWYPGSPCTPVRCEEETGACCFVDATGTATCAQTTMADCATLGGTWFFNTPCSPELCEEETGACCYVDEMGIATCAQTTMVDCAALGGTWFFNTPCSPELCEEEIGACCYIDEMGIATCAQTTMADCTALGGTWFFNTPCSPELCEEEIGACCYLDPVGLTCIQTTMANCTALGGTWFFNTPCSPELCEEEETGACCFLIAGTTFFGCTIVTQTECELEIGGFWQGAGTPCVPDPCPQPIPPCVNPPPGMVAWWPFDETAGVLANDIVQGKNGIGQPLGFGPVPAPGVVAGAWDFDGFDDQVFVPHTAKHNFDCGAFSIDAWINPTLDGLVPGGGIAQKMSTGVNGAGWIFQVENTGTLTLLLMDPCLRCVFSSGLSLPFNQWSHVAVTVSTCSTTCNDPCEPAPRTVSFYINGASAGSTTISSSCCFTGSTAPLFIGKTDIFGVNYFDGRIDELEIFDRVITPAEVAAIHGAGEFGKCKDRCHTTWEAPCRPDGTASVDVTICNWDVTPHTYQWALTPIPGTPNTVCNIDGPTIITPSSGTTLVPPGTCLTIPVIMQCTVDAIAGSHGCFQLCVTNLDTGFTRCCSGSVLVTPDWDPDPIDIVVEVPLDVVGVVGFSVGNVGSPDDELVLNLRAVPSEAMFDPDAPSLISLDGLPPGEPVVRMVKIPPGTTAPVEVDVSFVTIAPFGFHDVLLEIDLDGDGVLEPASSVGVRQIAIVEPPCPADLDGDGTVDGGDLGLLLGAWGGRGPADLNMDGTVSGADLGLLLGAWGPCPES